MVKSNLQNEAVGARLRLLRESRGVTLVRLAHELGITYQQVRKYENGQNRISVVALMEVARILDIDIAEFFDGLVPKPQTSSSDDAQPQSNELISVVLDRIDDPVVRRRMRDLIDALEAVSPTETILA